MKWIILAIVSLTIAFSDEIFAADRSVDREVECLAQNMTGSHAINLLKVYFLLET